VIELYNEVVKDLLSGRDNLQLAMSSHGLHIDGLTEQVCGSGRGGGKGASRDRLLVLVDAVKGRSKLLRPLICWA